MYLTETTTSFLTKVKKHILLLFCKPFTGLRFSDSPHKTAPINISLGTINCDVTLFNYVYIDRVLKALISILGVF